MGEWYYILNGQQVGPVTVEMLKKLAADHLLAPTQLLWRDGMTDWKPASTVEGIFDRNAAPAAAKPAAAKPAPAKPAPAKPAPAKPKAAPAEARETKAASTTTATETKPASSRPREAKPASTSSTSSKPAPAAVQKPVEPVEYAAPPPRSVGLIVGGYVCAGLALLLFWPAGIVGIIIGRMLVKRHEHTHGALILVLSSVFTLVSLVAVVAVISYYILN